MKKFVYSKVGNYEAKQIAICKNQQEAETMIRLFERQDRYEVACGYGFPYGMPAYEIRNK